MAKRGQFLFVYFQKIDTYCWIHGDLFLETTQKRQSDMVLDRYISEKPKDGQISRKRGQKGG